jgi:hypothetical protein
MGFDFVEGIRCFQGAGISASRLTYREDLCVGMTRRRAETGRDLGIQALVRPKPC